MGRLCTAFLWLFCFETDFTCTEWQFIMNSVLYVIDVAMTNIIRARTISVILLSLVPSVLKFYYVETNIYLCKLSVIRELFVMRCWRCTEWHMSHHSDYTRRIWSNYHIETEKKTAEIFADDIFKYFSPKAIVVFLFKFHWKLFPSIQLTIIKHWFRKWLGADKRQAIIWNSDGLI